MEINIQAGQLSGGFVRYRSIWCRDEHSVLLEHGDETPSSVNIDILFLLGFNGFLAVNAYDPSGFQ